MVFGEHHVQLGRRFRYLVREAMAGHRAAEDIRYNERSSAERVNANLKDNHGGRTIQLRGPAKVMCHLMFGVLVITVTQIIRLIA